MFIYGIGGSYNGSPGVTLLFDDEGDGRGDGNHIEFYNLNSGTGYSIYGFSDTFDNGDGVGIY
jgi:hypothetical protein